MIRCAVVMCILLHSNWRVYSRHGSSYCGLVPSRMFGDAEQDDKAECKEEVPDKRQGSICIGRHDILCNEGTVVDKVEDVPDHHGGNEDSHPN